MPTLDELREAYERENYHEDGAFSYDDMNAFHRKARAYIAALEADRAAQQQRIDALTKALEPFAALYWTDSRGIMKRSDDEIAYIPMTPEVYVKAGTLIIRVSHLRAAHAALHADAGENDE